MHGTERYALELAEYLPKDLYEVYIATPAKGPLSELIREKNLKEIVYENGKFNKFSFAGIKNLYRIIKENKFDIVHANSGIAPCMLGKLLNVKLCVEIKHGIFYTDEALKKLGFKTFLKEYIKQFFVNCFIAISENDKQRLIKFFKIKPNKIEVVYNGLNVKELESNPDVHNIANDKKDKIVIGTIGRYNYQKAYDVLVKAVEAVVQKEKNVEFWFIGTGEEEEKIKSDVKLKNLQDYIHYVGYTNEIFNYFKQFDIFVLASRYEGVPYVILEAMYLNKPIVCTRVGGIDNILKDNIHALISEPESHAELANNLLRLITNHDLIMELTGNSKKLINSFTSEIMAENTSKVYLKYLNY